MDGVRRPNRGVTQGGVYRGAVRGGKPRGSLLAVAALLATPVFADEPVPADSARPAAVETAGVPVVPQELLDQLQAYDSVRGAAFLGWAPSGNGMLIRTRFGTSGQLHRVYEPGGRREQLTFHEEPVSGGFLPGTDDDAILLTRDRGGDENDQVYLLDHEDYRELLLTDGASRNQLGPVTRDGSRIVVSSNRRNGRDTDLLVGDPRRAESLTPILEPDGQVWFASDWSPDGERLLIARYVSINEVHPAILPAAGGEPAPLTLPGDGPHGCGPLAFTADGAAVLLACDAEGEFRRLARYDLADGSLRWLSDDIPWDVSDLAVERVSGTVAFGVNADGASRLFLLTDPHAAEPDRRELDLPLGIVSGLEFSPDGAWLGFTLARPDAPPDAYALRLADGELVRWTYSELGGLDPRGFVTPERVQFESFDGRRIPAYVYRPRGASPERRAPVIIQIHGGPEGQFRPYFSPSTQFYVSRLGAAVIAPNVRGSSGYGKTYLTLDNGKLREDSVRDIGALLDWIAEQPDLDPARVAVMGGSYGGYMTLAALVHFGDRIKAGVDEVGIANFVTFLESTAAYRRDLRRAEYGDERDPAMRELLTQISPLTGVDRIRSALLVAHGKNDPRVPFAEAEQIAAAVRARGLPVWTVYAADEGHGFAKRPNADYLRAVTALFLAEQLK